MHINKRQQQNAKNRRLLSQNIVHLLENRESGYRRHDTKRCNWMQYEREFYRSITPRLTLQNIEIPNVYLRKFTPDGSKLLAFTQDQRSLQVFSYKGIGKARSLLDELGAASAECINVQDSPLRNRFFDALFDTQFLIRLCQGDFGRHHLHREFSIFLQDGRYVLLAAMCGHSSAPAPTAYVCYPDLFDKVDPFSYIFIVVDLELGCVSDELCLPHDAICMSHNHGVSVYGHTIAMLSRLHQCIYLFDIIDGRLVKQETIGPRPRDCYFDEQQDIGPLDLNSKLAITHIKQRVLSFLYRQIEQNVFLTRQQQLQEYQKFYKNFEFLEHMIMEKMQLINNDLLFLRYEERPKTSDIVVMGELLSPRRLYVFYAINNENVVGVYQDDSVELLNIILDYNDKLCNVRCRQFGDVPSSPTHQYINQNFINPTKAPHILRQAAQRFNPCVPISTQSFTVSPYLNYNLLSYEERQISPLERPKMCANEPIVFRDRVSNLIKFRLNAKARNATDPLAARELCAFIFHPFEPLVLSIQKFMQSYAYNAHIYNQSTEVQQL